MKKQLSSLEVFYLVKELQDITQAKVTKIFHPLKKEIVFDIFVSGKGKFLLNIKAPELIYLNEFKGDVPEKPSGFCMTLRKYLNNARLRKVRQHGFERVVEFVFENKDGFFNLVIELFSKGNIIFCDENYKIITLVEGQRWKNRDILPGKIYEFPMQDVDILKLDESTFFGIISNSNKESIVKTLALEFSLGGIIAEELCFLTGINKTRKKVSEDESKKLFKEFKGVFEKKIDSHIIYKGDDVKDIIPFDLNFYEKDKKEKIGRFNDALSKIFTQESKTGVKEKKESKYVKEVEKLKRIVDEQEKTIKDMKTKAEENNEKGELIYNNYTLVDDILNTIKEARKKYSWAEIKERLKGHKVIKQINEKEGKIIIEI